jgi:hypothetical protein
VGRGLQEGYEEERGQGRDRGAAAPAARRRVHAARREGLQLDELLAEVVDGIVKWASQ